MINLDELDQYRDRSKPVLALMGPGDSKGGIFWIPSKTDQRPMRVIAGNDEGWDHVSVSRQKRCPNWPEMEQIKRMFFLPDEVAFQLHVPADDHINFHTNCLHMWRCHDTDPPMPPRIFV